jgi:7-carboxy-7-deazaguanine synthase
MMDLSSLSNELPQLSPARMSPGNLLVSEIFGPTLQGEGPSAGRAAAFLRLGGCHLSCSWCDTAYTWDEANYNLAEELTALSTDSVLASLLAIRAAMVVITGGEPALQASECARLARDLRGWGVRTEVETSGTVPLKGLLLEATRVVASPKLANSGLAERARLRWAVLEELADAAHVAFKFVITEAGELAEVDEITRRLQVSPDRVWIMPEGTDERAVRDGLRDLAEPVVNRGWSLSSRLHVTIWGNQRGK